ncbi:MAG: hypothetical protein LUQ36_06135 [Methanoregula sp.]|nr:hypothetical protein [Methanoregula sp.]
MSEGILQKMADYPGLFRLPVFSDNQAGKKAERNHGVEQQNLYRPVPFPGGPAILRSVGLLAADRDQKVDEKPTSHSRFLKNPGLKITLPEDGSVDFL